MQLTLHPTLRSDANSAAFRPPPRGLAVSALKQHRNNCHNTRVLPVVYLCVLYFAEGSSSPRASVNNTDAAVREWGGRSGEVGERLTRRDDVTFAALLGPTPNTHVFNNPRRQTSATVPAPAGSAAYRRSRSRRGFRRCRCRGNGR